MKKYLLVIMLLGLTVILFQRCNEPLIPQLFSYYLPPEEILKVEINNVNGSFVLTEKQLSKFKQDISQCTTVPKLAVKAGSISMIITRSDSETFVIRGNSSSQYLEVSSDIATLNKNELSDVKWLTLTTNSLNFNNYKKRN